MREGGQERVDEGPATWWWQQRKVVKEGMGNGGWLGGQERGWTRERGLDRVDERLVMADDEMRDKKAIQYVSL